MHRKDAETRRERLEQAGAVPIHREEILKLWYSIEQEKEQIAKFVAWLIGTDFFRAPCSTEFHLCRAGGLAEHSLNVYRLLKEKVERYKLDDVTESDVIICGLGHDLCKANFYVPGYRNVKNDATGQWERKSVYKVEDQYPLGHGEKSLSILQDFFQLPEIIKLAVRWHMQSWDAGIHFNYPSGFAFREAVKKHPLVTLLFTADLESTYLIEAEHA
jgi:hypothetical protein